MITRAVILRIALLATAILAIVSIAVAAPADTWKEYRQPTLHYAFRYPTTMRVEPAKVALPGGQEAEGVELQPIGKRSLTFHWIQIYPVASDWTPAPNDGGFDCGKNELARRLAKPSARIYCWGEGAAGSTYDTLDYVIPRQGGLLVVELVLHHLNDPQMQLGPNGEVEALDENLSEAEQKREREKYEKAVADSDSLAEQTFEGIVKGLTVE